MLRRNAEQHWFHKVNPLTELPIWFRTHSHRHIHLPGIVPVHQRNKYVCSIRRTGSSTPDPAYVRTYVCVCTVALGCINRRLPFIVLLWQRSAFWRWFQQCLPRTNVTAGGQRTRNASGPLQSHTLSGWKNRPAHNGQRPYSFVCGLQPELAIMLSMLYRK